MKKEPKLTKLSTKPFLLSPIPGKAGDVTFKSDPKGPNYDRYALEWTGVSSTPITHFRVQYKAETDLQWADAELEAVNLDREFYAGGYTLPDLRPATVYLARVSSKNAYGYNDFGEIFKFATKGAGEFGFACLILLAYSLLVTLN